MLDEILRDIEFRAIENPIAAEMGIPGIGELHAKVLNTLARQAERNGDLALAIKLQNRSQEEIKLDRLAATVNGRQ